MKRLLPPLIAAALSVIALALLLALGGLPPSDSLRLLFRGSMGDAASLSETIVKSVPLLMTALAVVVAFRAGVWNIGGEGQFIVGGIAALAATRLTSSPLGAPIALLAGTAAGAAWAGLAAMMKNRRNAPEVLTTILLNFVAVHLLGWMVNGPLQERGAQYPQSEAIPAASELSALHPSAIHSGLLIALIVAVATWWLLFRTLEGLRIRAVGMNPRATAFAGVAVNARIARTMLLSGAIAGCGGAIELLGVTHRLYERFTADYGYSGITVALLAQTHPLGAIASSFFIAALRNGGGELQRSAGVSAAVTTLAEGVAVVALLAFHFRPKANAEETK